MPSFITNVKEFDFCYNALTNSDVQDYGPQAAYITIEIYINTTMRYLFATVAQSFCVVLTYEKKVENSL